MKEKVITDSYGENITLRYKDGILAIVQKTDKPKTIILNPREMQEIVEFIEEILNDNHNL